MYIKRAITPQLKEAAQEYGVVAILGPRQAGKTTLARHVFSQHKYISLEDYDVRALAHADPRSFLNDYPTDHGIILDEIQHAPHLLSYIQTMVDEEKKKGFFIVTGSQNFLVSQSITQTLAGRIAIITLLPLSIAEIGDAGLLPEKIETAVFTGSYPALYAEEISVKRLYQGYTATYLERDVRQIKNITDLMLFKKFISLCAGRTGQTINYSSLGNDCGIDDKTVKAWLSILEASYVVFFLQPYYKNFGKQLTKSPKLYFIDTGLVCSLLRIKSADELIDHSMRGPLIETFIIADLLKQHYNLELVPGLYFWRDHSGHEVDCLIDTGSKLVPVEIKSSKTVIPSYFSAIETWQGITKNEKKEAYVIYSGSDDQNWPFGKVVSWQSVGTLLKKIS
ncbi:MAG: ATP-binding protein [Candidatus Dependentiae bacterium]|nr:ATP-binding protein [Candidatus Dependentiae bacterium]